MFKDDGEPLDAWPLALNLNLSPSGYQPRPFKARDSSDDGLAKTPLQFGAFRRPITNHSLSRPQRVRPVPSDLMHRVETRGPRVKPILDGILSDFDLPRQSKLLSSPSDGRGYPIEVKPSWQAEQCSAPASPARVRTSQLCRRYMLPSSFSSSCSVSGSRDRGADATANTAGLAFSTSEELGEGWVSPIESGRTTIVPSMLNPLRALLPVEQLRHMPKRARPSWNCQRCLKKRSRESVISSFELSLKRAY